MKNGESTFSNSICLPPFRRAEIIHAAIGRQGGGREAIHNGNQGREGRGSWRQYRPGNGSYETAAKKWQMISGVTGLGKKAPARFGELEVKKLRSAACCRQENVIFPPHIPQTWPEPFSRAL